MSEDRPSFLRSARVLIIGLLAAVVIPGLALILVALSNNVVPQGRKVARRTILPIVQTNA